MKRASSNKDAMVESGLCKEGGTVAPRKKMKMQQIDLNKTIHNKEIFKTIFVNGWKENGIIKFNKETGEESCQPVAKCPKCGKKCQAPHEKNYTNPASHVKRCMGEANVIAAVKKARLLAAEENNLNISKVQQKSILGAMCQANDQDKTLNRMAILAILHNTPINKFRDESYVEAILLDPVSIDVFVSFLLWLTFVVEEKIGKEMKGKKGMVYHDGWTKYGTHFVSLFASYVVPCASRNPYKKVMRLLSVSTLPHDDDDTNTAVNFNAKTHASWFNTVFNNLGFDKLKDFAPVQCGKCCEN
jgi:hypothetical protein